MDLPFVRHATRVENVRRMRDMFWTDILSESDVVDSSHCYLAHPLSSIYLIREVDTWGRRLDMEVRQRLIGLLVGWQNIKLFAELPARRGLLKAARPAFGHDPESPR